MASDQKIHNLSRNMQFFVSGPHSRCMEIGLQYFPPHKTQLIISKVFLRMERINTFRC
jgi:hypothetical protein